MPDGILSAFHFLRPWWLVALLPLAVMLALIVRRQRPDVQWAAIIAPHLLKHLVVEPSRRRVVRPVYLVALGLTLGIVALAGPTWRRELPPFVEDKAPLMIALDVSSSMSQTDVAPSRLERAKQKIRDLLSARAGARTGLIAYAGSAHLVMPLTDDRSVIEPFLSALSPGIMPVDGARPVTAIALGADTLAAETVAGTILLVADQLGEADETALRQAAGRNALLFLSVTPPEAEEGAASALRSQTVRATVDDGDIRALERRIETRFQAAQTDQHGTRWQDEGYWLLVPVALIGLLWFRRGTTVQWAILFLLLHAAPASAEGTSWFKELWLTPDQQGQLAFDRGNYAEAARLFKNPMWRGIAAYRAYDYLAAAEAFRQIPTIEGHFALGNAEANNHAYAKAIKAYDEVLAAQPDHIAAKTNRAIVRAALEAQEEARRKKEEGETAPDLPPDEVKVDEKQQEGKRIKVQSQDVTSADAAEAWMREVQTSPADFLKLKFAIQAAPPPAAQEPAR